LHQEGFAGFADALEKRVEESAGSIVGKDYIVGAVLRHGSSYRVWCWKHGGFRDFQDATFARIAGCVDDRKPIQTEFPLVDSPGAALLVAPK
jgi:hypothetical protein